MPRAFPFAPTPPSYTIILHGLLRKEAYSLTSELWEPIETQTISLQDERGQDIVIWPINALLILLVVDFVFSPVYDSATNAIFTHIDHMIHPPTPHNCATALA